MAKRRPDLGSLGHRVPLPESPGQGPARPRGKSACRYALRRPLHGARVHGALPGHRPARLRPPRDRLRAEAWLVESKSLKLYLASFRNHGAFHEDCTVAIGKRIAALLEPALPAHRRLLVPARRHADRRVLADRHAPRRRVAARPGRRALPRARLSRRATQRSAIAEARAVPGIAPANAAAGKQQRHRIDMAARLVRTS